MCLLKCGFVLKCLRKNKKDLHGRKKKEESKRCCTEKKINLQLTERKFNDRHENLPEDR